MSNNLKISILGLRGWNGSTLMVQFQPPNISLLALLGSTAGFIVGTAYNQQSDQPTIGFVDAESTRQNSN